MLVVGHRLVDAEFGKLGVALGTTLLSLTLRATAPSHTLWVQVASLEGYGRLRRRTAKLTPRKHSVLLYNGVYMSITVTEHGHSETWREEIRKEAERIHESAMLSSETQFEYAKRWRRADRWIGGLASALAALAGVGALAEAFSATWAGVIAIASALAGSVAASLGAPKTKEKASISANAFRALQQDTRIFLKIDLRGLDEREARERLQSLVDRLQELNKEAEIPSPKAWGRAKETLNAGSQTYGVDE